MLLRAERAGGGNGRVYQITFEADDGIGGVGINCLQAAAIGRAETLIAIDVVPEKLPWRASWGRPTA